MFINIPNSVIDISDIQLTLQSSEMHDECARQNELGVLGGLTESNQ